MHLKTVFAFPFPDIFFFICFFSFFFLVWNLLRKECFFSLLLDGLNPSPQFITSNVNLSAILTKI